MQPPYSVDGHAIRIALAVRGLTQRALADAVPMDPSRLCRIVRGRYRVRPEELRAIWNALTVPIPNGHAEKVGA